MISTTATVEKATPLRETPDGGTTFTELAPRTTVEVAAWVFGPDERVHYRLRSAEAVGWAEPGPIALHAPDPVTRQVDGRSIVEPLQGKGLWFVLDSREQGWDGARRVAAAARANDISHLYVEVATSRRGFWGARWLHELLPAARAAGVRVIGSVYPYLDDLPTDLALAREVAQYRTPEGLMLDGLTADIEETLVPENIQAYGGLLRYYIGDDDLLVATVYPPESWFTLRCPWPALAAGWNAIAPMA